MELNKPTLEFMMVWWFTYGDREASGYSHDMSPRLRKLYSEPHAWGVVPLLNEGLMEYTPSGDVRISKKGIEAVQRYIVTMAEPMGVAEATAETENE